VFYEIQNNIFSAFIQSITVASELLKLGLIYLYKPPCKTKNVPSLKTLIKTHLSNVGLEFFQYTFSG